MKKLEISQMENLQGGLTCKQAGYLTNVGMVAGIFGAEIGWMIGGAYFSWYLSNCV